MKTWMISNNLQMNEDKTEVLLVIAKCIVHFQQLSEFMNINGSCVNFSPSVRNLGLTLDSTLSMHQHAMDVCTVNTVKTLVCSLVFSCNDYCNSLLVGLPHYLIKRLHGV